MTALRYGIRALGLALFVAVVFYVPFRISDFRASEFALIGVYFIAILGLNILTGYTGAISLGHGAFMAIGGYTTAILVADHGMKDLWTIPIAALVAAAAGFAFGLPALRLSGPYLALATFGIAVATPIVIKKFDGLTGGSGGINLFEAEGITGLPEFIVTLPGGHQLSFNDWLYYLTWTIALVLFVVAWGIHHSRLGRSLRAIRDNELAAAASGVWLAAHKTLAFTLSAFYAGRVKALQREGSPAIQIWKGFPRDISGFGALKDAPHPNAARAFFNYFFSDEAAQGAADFALATNYDPANVKAIPLLDPADDTTRATNPDNWNAMLAMDVAAYQEQAEEIAERWQEWISQ